MKKKYPADYIIIFAVLALTCIGIIMVFSASIYSSSAKYGDEYFIFRKQLIYGALGFVVMFIVSKIDYNIYKKYHKLILSISILLLGIVLIPGIGFNVNGATRWIRIGTSISFQPSEIAKIGIIIYMAASLSNKKNDIRKFSKGILPYLIIMIIVCGLIYLEPDLSTAVVFVAIIIGMIFISGGNLAYLIGIFSVAVGGVFFFIASTSWRMERFLGFLNPEENMSDSAWQVTQSLLALGSGGIFGQGLGNGKQKMFFMPEPQNDFIFAHIGEELGLIGTLLILSLYMLLIWRGLRIAIYVNDSFASLLACGLVLMIGIQVIINIAVVTNLIPTTGMPLPFLSAGGSSLVFLLGGVGILLNISKNTPISGR